MAPRTSTIALFGDQAVQKLECEALNSNDNTAQRVLEVLEKQSGKRVAQSSHGSLKEEESESSVFSNDSWNPFATELETKVADALCPPGSSDSVDLDKAIRAGKDQASKCNAFVVNKTGVNGSQRYLMKHRHWSSDYSIGKQEEGDQIRELKRRGAFLLISFVFLVLAAAILASALSRRLDRKLRSPASIAPPNKRTAIPPLAPSFSPSRVPNTKNVFDPATSARTPHPWNT